MTQTIGTEQPATLETAEILTGARVANYTPHAVTVFAEDNSILAEFPTTEHVARATEDEKKLAEIKLPNGAHIDLLETHYGEPVDLPDPQEGTYLIVSPTTAFAAREAGRPYHDLLIPAHAVRDDKGQMIGCRQFTVLD